MQYDDMPDFDINKLVAEALGHQVCNSHYPGHENAIIIVGGPNYAVDYCNNPSDAWPIIVENKIAIDFIDGFGWTANSVFDFYISESCYNRPLRAAMIVFLQMRDVLA